MATGNTNGSCMTAKQAKDICERVHMHWPRLALKSRNTTGRPEFTDKAKDWSAAFKKLGFDAVREAVTDWFTTRKQEPTLADLIKNARAWQNVADRHAWALQFQHGDILMERGDLHFYGILDKQHGAVYREVCLAGRNDNRPYWAILGSFRDMSDPGDGVFARLYLCPPDQALAQVRRWQDLYAENTNHWQFDVPVRLWEIAAERLLKQRT